VFLQKLEIRTLDEAVKRAQAMGVAETDPAADLDGWDAAIKVAALAIVLMGVPVNLDHVAAHRHPRSQRRKNSLVRGAGMRYKLVAARNAAATARLALCSRNCSLLPTPLANLEGTSQRFVLTWMYSAFRLSSTIRSRSDRYGLLADFLRRAGIILIRRACRSVPAVPEQREPACPSA